MARLEKRDDNKRLRFWISKENKDWLDEQDTSDGVAALMNEIMTQHRTALVAKEMRYEELYTGSEQHLS